MHQRGGKKEKNRITQQGRKPFFRRLPKAAEKIRKLILSACFAQRVASNRTKAGCGMTTKEENPSP
jgi:hypothetical protein